MSYALGQGTGPLAGVKVVEIAGIGPGPHACMILADLGADVIRVERPGGQALTGGPTDLLNRGRPSVALDLKNPEAIATVLDLVAEADVLVEGMRPGTTERLGLGPEECLERNPRLVYGRMTGWGQTGPLASAAGHDMNYIAITGALFGMGQDKARPHFPANLVGDFGGGSTYLVIGVLAALLEARISGKGQVVDAAIVDGTAHLNAMSAGFLAAGNLLEERAANLLDGGMPFYDLYETSDGRHMSVGPLEPQFYEEFVKLLDIEDAPDRYDFETHRGAARRHRRAVRGAHPGRVVGGLRGHRRLRRADHPAHRGDGAPAHGGPRGVRRARGRPAAGARPALLPYAGRARPAAAPEGRRRHPRGTGRLGHRGRRRPDREGRRRPGVRPVPLASQPWLTHSREQWRS